MDRLFYKLDIQGIVYLVDPTTSNAHTYDLSNPTEIGKIIWTNDKLPPKIELVADWKSILTEKANATKSEANTA